MAIAALVLPTGAVAATLLEPVNLDPAQLVVGASDEGVETDGSGPEMAFDGTKFLMVWHGGGTVHGALVTPGGAISEPGVLTFGSGTGYRPSVAWDGAEFLVAWTDSSTVDDSTRAVLAVRISNTGTVLDSTPVVIGRDAKPRRISLAWDGTNFLVVWRTSFDGIKAGRVSTAPAPLDGDGFTIGGGFYPSVAYAANSGKYLVAWHAWGTGLDIVGAFVSPAGTASAPFTIFGGAGDQDHVSLASDGTGFLVTWNDWTRGNQQNFGASAATRIAADGTVLDSPPIKVSDLEWRQGTKRTATFDGIDYAVAWPEDKYPVKHRLSDIYMRRISTGGEIVDRDPIPVATGMGHQTGPTVGTAGSRYVVTYFDTGPRCPWPEKCIEARLFDRANGNQPAISGEPGTATEVGTWQRMTSPIEAPIHTVAALDGDSAFAGTEPDGGPPWDQNPLLRWDGSSWSVAGMLKNARKYGIWASSPTRVFSASSGGNIVWWDGSASVMGANLWDDVGPLTPMGTGIQGFGEWSMVYSGVSGVVARSFATQQNDWQNGACLTLDGAAYSYWGQWDCDHIRGRQDNWDVAGRFSDDIWVVGENATLAHFDGHDWTLVPVPTPESLNGVWESAGGEIFAVGDFGTIVHWDGSSWTLMASPTRQHLFAVAGFTPDDVYAVGNGGTIVHFDGSAWSSETSGTDNTLEDVAVGDSTVFVVGSRDDDWYGTGPGTLLQKERTIIDSSAPLNPELSSSTHPTGDWRPDAAIKVQFDGGADDGRGIAGYSVALDHSATTTPPAVQNLGRAATYFTDSVADGEWWFHIRTVDRAGNWSGTRHLGPLRIDTTPPVNVTLTGAPAPGVWTNSGNFRVDWSWSDARSGIGAYRYVVDQNPGTIPDRWYNLGADATGVDVNRGPGDWWVHVRAVDGANSGVVTPPGPLGCEQMWPCGNWSDTVQIGPFRVDDQPPGNPVLSSTSHVVGQPSADNTIDISWGRADDDRSGVDGYDYSWIQAPDGGVPGVKRLPADASTLTSPALADGDWWFYIRTVDRAGNWSQSTSIGPFVIHTAVAPPPSGGETPAGGGRTAPTVVAPRIRSFRLARSVFRSGARIRSVIELSADATVTARVQRAEPGRSSRGRCRVPSKRLAHTPRCTRWVNVGKAAVRSAHAGKTALTFGPRLDGRLPKPGRYRLRAVASNSAGSAAAVAAFRIR